MEILVGLVPLDIHIKQVAMTTCHRMISTNISGTRTVLTRRVSSYGLPAALSDYGVNAAGIAEIVVIFRNDSSLAAGAAPRF